MAKKQHYLGMDIWLLPGAVMPERARILNLVDSFIQMYPDEEFGFAHLVLSDYNLDDHFINVCLNRVDDLPHSPVTTAFLQFLLTIPENIRTEWDE